MVLLTLLGIPKFLPVGAQYCDYATIRPSSERKHARKTDQTDACSVLSADGGRWASIMCSGESVLFLTLLECYDNRTAAR